MIKSYRDLIVWQKSMDLAVEVYRLSRLLPPSERYGLASQLQRSAAAIPANIAEGHERGSRGDFRRQVSVARGSLAELETHLELAERVGVLPRTEVQATDSRIAEVGRMLTVLLRRLKRETRP